MPEISTAIRIGFLCADSKIQFDGVQMLKRLGYKNIIQSEDLAAAYALVLNSEVDLILIDYLIDETPNHKLLLDLCHYQGKYRVPIVTLTGQYKMNGDDILFCKENGFEHVLATPFTQKSISVNIIGAWNRFYSKKSPAPLKVSLHNFYEALQSKEYVVASSLLATLSENPNINPISGELHALYHCATNDLAKTIKTLESYTTQTTPWVHYRAAEIFVHCNEYTRALAELDRMGETQYLPASMLKGQCQLLLRLFDEAQSTFEELLKENPKSNRVRNQLAIIFKEKGDFDTALEHYQAILKSAPNSYKIKFNVALVLEKKGQIKEALTILQQILAKHPDYAVAKKKMNQLVKAQQ